MIPRTQGGPDGRLARADEDRALPTDEIPGRALATRRAAADLVRAAVLGSYGVAGFEVTLAERVRATLAGRQAGLRIRVIDGRLTIALRLRVIAGLPVAEVARQVDSAVRYAIRRALDREVDELRIRIAGLEASPGTPPPDHRRASTGASDLADSGSDVA
jgi:uncharacterized alkaline shock family protein YloU